MADQKDLSIGTHFGEVPKIYICNREGQRKGGADGELKINPIDGSHVMSCKFEESIELPCVIGEIIYKDYGKFRAGHIFENGYDYLDIVFKGNHDPAKDETEVMFEIINVTSIEAGYLVGSTYDVIRLEVAQYPIYRNYKVWNVSKGYEEDTVIHDIVEDIKDEFLDKHNIRVKEIKLEQTKNKLKSFCIPFWNPLTCMKYLSYIAMNSNGAGGYFFFNDLRGHFHFQSLEELMSAGDTHNYEMEAIRVTEYDQGKNDTQQLVKDFREDLANKSYYSIGLAGTTIERFDWFKKKNYTYKLGYKKRKPKNVNDLYEKDEYVNNFYGFHTNSGFRNNENDIDHMKAITYNQLLTSLSNQCQSKIVINGKANIKCGDRMNVSVSTKVNENSESIDGEWFIRGILHSFNARFGTFKQVLSLSRIGNFDHSISG